MKTKTLDERIDYAIVVVDGRFAHLSEVEKMPLVAALVVAESNQDLAAMVSEQTNALQMLATSLGLLGDQIGGPVFLRGENLSA